MIDLDAITARARDFFGLYHPTVGPCRCGSCNPVAHPAHPCHEQMGEVHGDHNDLIAEVRRLRFREDEVIAMRSILAHNLESADSVKPSREFAEAIDGRIHDLEQAALRHQQNAAFVADIDATYPEEEQ